MFSQLLQAKFYSKQTLKVTMLGPNGAGKTSLLCAMYDKFDQIIGKTNLQLIPKSETKTILDNRLKELKDSVKEVSIKVRNGLAYTTDKKTYSFDLGKTGVSPSLELEFQDYPGGWINDGDHRKKIENYIQESVAILIAIDTPALMENNGQWHDKLNQPDIIYNLLKSSFQNLNSPKLVIFAPVKCEKYLRENGGEEKLLNCVQQNYSNLLSFFRSDALIPHIAAVMTPVETLGSVNFSRVEEDHENKEFIFYFRKPDPNKFYEPKDSDQPLRYLLRFIVRLFLDNRKIPFLNNLFNIMGRDKAFIEAMSEFSNGCKNNGAFVIFQGANLLRIN